MIMKKKGWLLSGYKIDPNYKKIGTKKAQDEISEISAQSDPTQYGPTFWRPALVACAIDSLTDFFRKQKLSFWQSLHKAQKLPKRIIKVKNISAI